MNGRRGWVIAALVLGLGMVVHVATGESQETRGSAKVLYAAPEGGNKGFKGQVQLYDKSHAVVIGIDKYSKIRPLTGAVRDARAVEKALKAHGFEVTTLIDGQATRAVVTELLADELRTKVGKNDRVLIYFAGHGTTIGNGHTASGYLMPVEGDFTKAASTGISMREVQSWLASYPSKHVFYVADACYSGLSLPPATTRSGDFRELPDYLRKVVGQRVQLTLVAGARDEQVYEWNNHGLFTYYFLRALQGDADTDNDGLVTGDELAAFVKPKVRQTAWSEFNAQQNPHMGRRGDGEFILLNPNWKGGAAVAARPPTRSNGGGGGPRPKANSGGGGGGGSTAGMIKIPAGKFPRGSEDGDFDEDPVRQIYLDDYFIDQHEVTVGEYRRCVEAKVCAVPKRTTGNRYNWKRKGRDKHPINGVLWSQAQKYCEWAGKRLPTEAEWEKAARGTKALKYPWGSKEPNCELAVMDSDGTGCGGGVSWPVEQLPDGKSPYGVYDMAGNVAEWVLDIHEDDYYKGSPPRNPQGPHKEFGVIRRVVRGGHFDSDDSGLRSANREEQNPDSAEYWLGFRCAKSP